MYHEMTIYGFTLDAIARMPVIILKDAAGKNSLPIWINTQESVSLAGELISRDISSQSGRGDLLTNLLQRLKLTIGTVTIESLQDGIFTASVRFSGKGKDFTVDIHISEAMITALKYKLPVMVHEEVIKQASMLDFNEGNFSRETDARRFVDFLENLDPAALGKYPM